MVSLSAMTMPRRALLSCALAVLCGGLPCPAAEQWRIVVEAGPVDRSGLPLRVPIAMPEASAPAAGQAVRVRLPDGSSVDGQVAAPGLLARRGPSAGGVVARQIVFVLPRLAAGTKVEVLAETGGIVAQEPTRDPASPRLRWVEEGNGVELLLAGKPVVRYEMPAYDAASEETRVRTYKPFHHVYDPLTGIRLTKGDGGVFTHHRGLFFGYNTISHGEGMKVRSDDWHCHGKARQEHREIVQQEAGAVEGRQRVRIDWIGSDESKVLEETRELEVVPVPGGTVIDFASRLESAGPVRLEGDPQHAGVHFRASNEVAESTKGQTYYLRPGTKGVPGDYRNWPDDRAYVNAAWHAASFVVGGQRYTVLRANRPANPGEARMSERDYARFGSYFEYDLRRDKPLDVGYRWWIQPGELTLEDATRIAADYAQPAAVTVKPAGG